METIIIKRRTGAYYLGIPDLSYADLLLLMQATEKTLPELSGAIRTFISDLAGGRGEMS
jgi:hypothetical protein